MTLLEGDKDKGKYGDRLGNNCIHSFTLFLQDHRKEASKGRLVGGRQEEFTEDQRRFSIWYISFEVLLFARRIFRLRPTDAWQYIGSKDRIQESCKRGLFQLQRVMGSSTEQESCVRGR